MSTDLEDVVPDGRSAKVDVEVGVRVLDAHQAVLLNFGPRHVAVPRPVVVHPAQFPRDVRRLH